MKRDERLRQGLVKALIAAYTTVPAAGAIDQKTAGEILERWDELSKLDAAMPEIEEMMSMLAEKLTDFKEQIDALVEERT